MATMMKTLMDEFYDLKTKSTDFEYRVVCDMAESMANNCHGKTSADTVDYVRRAMRLAEDAMDLTDPQKDAHRDIYEILDIAEALLC